MGSPYSEAKAKATTPRKLDASGLESYEKAAVPQNEQQKGNRSTLSLYVKIRRRPLTTHRARVVFKSCCSDAPGLNLLKPKSWAEIYSVHQPKTSDPPGIIVGELRFHWLRSCLARHHVRERCSVPIVNQPTFTADS